MKPLTEMMRSALLDAEETPYGDVKMIDGYGRSMKGLRDRGLVEGDLPHVYLTDAGKMELAWLIAPFA